MRKPLPKATDRLSKNAWDKIKQGFAANKTFVAIARDVAAIGERVSENALQRRHVEWSAENERLSAEKRYVNNLVDAGKTDPAAAEIIRALATDALVKAPTDFTSADPIKVQALNLKAEEVQLAREKEARELAKLELDREKVQLEREKFERLKEKDKLMVAAATAVKKVADQASPELKRRIEEMYDIAIAA